MSSFYTEAYTKTGMERNIILKWCDAEGFAPMEWSDAIGFLDD